MFSHESATIGAAVADAALASATRTFSRVSWHSAGRPEGEEEGVDRRGLRRDSLGEVERRALVGEQQAFGGVFVGDHTGPEILRGLRENGYVSRQATDRFALGTVERLADVQELGQADSGPGLRDDH